MRKVVGLILLAIAAPTAALAGTLPAAPEIDANTAVAAIVLVSGAALVLRGRRAKK